LTIPLIGLQWGDVDFHGGFIEVRRGVVLRQETTPKSHKIRRVDMSQQLQATLKKIKELHQLEAMAEGKELVPWVFLAKGGQRWDDRHLRRVWVKCLDTAGLRQVRFHDLRHTYRQNWRNRKRLPNMCNPNWAIPPSR